jgi:hypothetical protein
MLLILSDRCKWYPSKSFNEFLEKYDRNCVTQHHLKYSFIKSDCIHSVAHGNKENLMNKFIKEIGSNNLNYHHLAESSAQYRLAYNLRKLSRTTKTQSQINRKVDWHTTYYIVCQSSDIQVKRYF